MTKAKAFTRKALGAVRGASIGPTVPGLAAMALIALGAALVYLPAGIIAGGLLLLRVDSRM
jgi:hypothetical protein